MGEQIPCPVCTLFLHPGMNLADHLETHPKEQVIKALVSLASGAQSIRSPASTSLIPAQHGLPPIESSQNASLLTSSESKVGFIAPHNRNVMIVNRQSTMVYQSSDAGHQRMLTQAVPIAPPPIEMFTLPQQDSTKFLPPPPAYGTAINQMRSHHNHSPNIPNQQSQYENPYYGISNQSNIIDTGLSRHSPRLSLCSRNPSPRSTSSPSVLRYAESPVTAHYVEKENGDFLLHETPRHIVECVEKDDGEFSVIEKVIKSPPCVVQFHDDSDHSEDENNESVNTVCNGEDNISDLDGRNMQKSVAATVTVLSNVKLAPKESLNLMENIIASKPANVEFLWTTLVEPVSEKVENEISEKNTSSFEQDKVMESDLEEIPDPEINAKSESGQSSSSAATSVIRLATIQKNSSPPKNQLAVDKSESLEKNIPKPKYTREPAKRPFKKTPKKLVVKFKNPPLTGNSGVSVADPQPGPSDVPEKETPRVEASSVKEKIEVLPNETCHTSFEDVSAVQVKIDVFDQRESDVCAGEKVSNNQFQASKSNNSEIPVEVHHNETILKSDELDETSVEQMDSSSLEETNDENLEIRRKEEALDVELDTASMPIVIVHEPSLLEEPTFDRDEEDKTTDNTVTDKKDTEFSKLLSECMKNNAPESYSIHLSTIESISENIKESTSTNSDCATENNDSEPQKHEPGSLNSFPSTSFSKPAASSFTLREQTDFQSSHSYNDYPFSFLYANNIEKNCLSPIYPSDEQSWHRCNGPALQQHTQIQISDFDGERSSYIDLDACKKNNSTDTLPSVDTLNIRTDEKMPAKGEISEQESNGEIDLSWGQTVYNDSQRFHNQPENYGTRESGSFSNEGFFFYPQNLNADTKVLKSPQHTNSEEKPDLLEPKRKERKSSIVKKRKTFQCDHCFSVFVKLKDRNSHLLEQHSYKRVNRRLVRELPAATITAAEVEEMQQTEDVENSDVKKPEITAIASVESSHLPRTKYDSIRAGVYRMLMNFNLSILQQNQNIDVDKSLFDSKSFCCYTCKRDFISVKSFDEHLTEHPAECFTCGKKFTRWTYFSIHLKRHLGWKDFACTVCSKKFVIRSALIEHMRMHTGVTPLKCKFCDKHFKRYSNLTQHKRVCHQTKNSRKKDYVCHCGEVLPSKARFLWHKETHDTKPKCCPYCRDRFIHSNSLRRHIRLAHSDKFSYAEPTECPICNQVYAKTSLKAHMSTHSMDTQHECVICNKSFSTKWNLKIHSWVHANRTSKPFKCDLCVKAFVREVDYKNHINAHKQIKPYTCEYCGCKFIRKYNYMRHRREHHGQKKFGCDLCGKLFHRHYYLIEHRRTHTGERPFLCTICGKSSTTKTNHNKHLKIHHSRDPFTTET